MIILDRNSKIPLYMQIYQHIRDEIIAGDLTEGHRLSATRSQAQQLGVSRNTVEQAYMQLTAEGYLDNRRGSGFYVRHVDASLTGSFREKKLQDFHRQRAGKQTYLYDMKYGSCTSEDFPHRKWRRAVEGAMAAGEIKLAAYGDPCGQWELRTYLADYLERSRGVCCSPDQIIIISGTQIAMSILCRLLELRKCAVEEPGYDGVRYVLENQGIELAPVSVNENGMDLGLLAEEQVQAAYVTPSHQFPLGAVMPIQARMELLRLAQQKGFYIIEDDYDSVFRYEAKAVPSLQGLDKDDRVIYLGTVSKALAPSLRLAYMVLPGSLKNKYDMWFSQYHNTVPAIIQDALSLFIAEGNWERHLRKTCLTNKRKHDLLASELEQGLGPEFQVLGKGAGLHLIIESFAFTAEEMIVRSQQQDVNVYSLEKYFALGTSRNLIMAGFGGIPLRSIGDAAQRIVKAFT